MPFGSLPFAQVEERDASRKAERLSLNRVEIPL